IFLYLRKELIAPPYMDGGAINYAAHAAVKVGRKVAVVTRLTEEDKRVVDKFKSDGIDCFIRWHKKAAQYKSPTE
ncbi:MAG: hypothetical protein WAV05_03855, partial [Anaerolineales bacterium]